jgi:hypothetical protein
MKSLFLIIVLTVSTAFAGDLGTCASFTNSDVVFAGKVAAVDGAQKSEELPEGTKKVRFQVTRNFKGAENPTFAIFSNGSFPFRKGEIWIVFASNDIVYKSFAASDAVRVEKETGPSQIESIATIAAGAMPATVGGVIIGSTGSGPAKPVEIAVTGKNTSLSATAGTDGRFSVELPNGGRYRVRMTLPFETDVVWPDRLLGTSLRRGVPTVFEYDIEIEKGDCSYSKFELR